ncbi:30S ribosomal protein S3, partial [Acinetobacter baumannii]
LDAQLVAEEIALQIERRVSHRRAMKRAIDNAFKAGAKGVKVQVKGRIGGAELARAEWFLVGRMPLQTLRADIDYGFAVAQTKYGVLGVKVWIYKRDVIKDRKEEINKKIEEDLKKAEKKV